MIEAIDELKTRARLLSKRAEAGDADALVRIASKRARDSAPTDPSYGECLRTIAIELGFSSFPHARRVLLGDESEADFGTFLYTTSCGAYLNNWQVDDRLAREVIDADGGTIVPYKRQFLVVGSGVLATLGLDPDDPDWEAVGRDLVRPRSAAARLRIYAKRLAAIPREIAA